VDTCPAIIARYFARPDVVFIPLREAAPTTLVLAVNREVRQPIIDEFVELAIEIAANATRNPGTGYAAPTRKEADEPAIRSGAAGARRAARAASSA
jgi:hypothetical protein